VPAPATSAFATVLCAMQGLSRLMAMWAPHTPDLCKTQATDLLDPLYLSYLPYLSYPS